MEISEHADHTEKQVGVRAEDIHKWIDGFFDAESFDQLVRSGRSPDYDPYEHRRYRHCREALEDAYREFAGNYSKEQIKGVFECHIRDDYNGYLPTREDFENGTFTEKYHESDDHAKNELILNKEELSEYFKGKVYSRNKPFAHRHSSVFILRILVPTVIAIVLFVTSVFVFVIPAFRNNMMERKKEMIKELTAAAVSVIEYCIGLEKKGELSRQDAQKRAVDEIRAMRYGDNNKDYFWITDMHPHMVMHPYRPDLVGDDLSEYRDNNKETGKKLFVEFVRIVKTNNEGYVEYLWQWKDDYSRITPKLSYVKGIPHWGWIIGTGIYLNDVEVEMQKLTTNLWTMFAVISIGLVVILASVVIQSHRIENNRIQAESGLREAKDRYRALVEASNEGYVLVIDGKTTYSNHTLQRMLGYSEDKLAEIKVWDFLVESESENVLGPGHLKNMIDGEISPADFEAQVMARDGWMIDVVISVSKMFFSNSDGHVISFRPIKRTKGVIGGAPSSDISSSGYLSTQILEEIDKSRNVGHIVQSLNRLSMLIRDMTEQGARPDVLRKTVGSVFDVAVKSLIEIAIGELGPPPVAFAFLLLGSNARHEMTMFSDQDNALVFRDVSEAEQEQAQKYFLKLSHSVCRKLKQAGYPYCPGSIMAVNPQWCLPVSGWRRNFSDWIENASPQSILDINVFYDMRAVYGDGSLADELVRHIHELSENNQPFFNYFARNCLTYDAPLGLLGHIKSETHDGVKTVDIKRSLKPLEVFARIYALRHELVEVDTTARLKKLEEEEILSTQMVEEMIYIFDYLWRLRFYNQLSLHADLRRVSDELRLEALTEVEHQNLQNALSKISTFQEKLSSDFLGMPLYRSRET